MTELTPEQEKVAKAIRQQIDQYPVILYMKGSPQFPQCGFSSRVATIMNDIGEPFAFINILDHPEIRATLPLIADWPTFPQLYVKGELVGGCDIVEEMHEQGELAPMLVGHDWGEAESDDESTES